MYQLALKSFTNGKPSLLRYDETLLLDSSDKLDPKVALATWMFNQWTAIENTYCVLCSEAGDFVGLFYGALVGGGNP